MKMHVKYPSQKAKITYQPESTPEFPYNVQILQQLFDTKIWFYTGRGKFCRTSLEAISYVREQRNIVEVI